MALEKVLLTLNGVEHEVTFSWDDTTSEGTAEITVTAPDETSWHLPGHYYPIGIQLDGSGGFMGQGEYLSTTYTADDLEALRLVVKERKPPTIDIIYPSNGFYLTERDNDLKFYILDEVAGSSINFNTLAVVVAGIDITETVHSVASANGYYCTCKIPDTARGDYTITISVSDNDENNTEVSIGYKYLVLITDRTLADVEAAKATGIGSPDIKGSYNASDLNRVEMAVEYMTRRLVAYNLTPVTKKDWVITDIPTADEMSRYLQNVKTIRDTLPTGSLLPESMNKLDYIGANQIEQAIIDTDNLINDIASQYFYSGEIYGGEV